MKDNNISVDDVLDNLVVKTFGLRRPAKTQIPKARQELYDLISSEAVPISDTQDAVLIDDLERLFNLEDGANNARPN